MAIIGTNVALTAGTHLNNHDDIIKWTHFPHYWPFVRGIHRSPLNSPHKGEWRDALMFFFICAWINAQVNNHEAGDLRRHRAHYDVIVMNDNLSRYADFHYKVKMVVTWHVCIGTGPWKFGNFALTSFHTSCTLFSELKYTLWLLTHWGLVMHIFFSTTYQHWFR